MRLEIDYYFKEEKDDSFFQKIKQGAENILDLFCKKEEFIQKEIIAKNRKENYGEIEDSATLSGNYYIGEGTKIGKGCKIEGPVYIGKNCEILFQAYLRPGTILEDNCVVGFNSEVKNTWMRRGSKISSLGFAGDSILGRSARIGSGAITSNRRFDQKNIYYKEEKGQKKDTNRAFLGCVLGDCSRIGANATTSPGTFIGPYSWIYPLTSVFGFIPEQTKVYQKPDLIFQENEKIELKKATWQNEIKK